MTRKEKGGEELRGFEKEDYRGAPKNKLLCFYSN